MAVDSNDSFIQLSLKELSEDDPCADILQKLVDSLQVSLLNPGAAAGVSICNESFLDSFVGSYCIREDGSGNTIGLFKRINNQLRQIALPLRGEIKIIKGSGIGPVTVPIGWQLITDSEIQSKYNIGTSPNWKAAAIEYIGI